MLFILAFSIFFKNQMSSPVLGIVGVARLYNNSLEYVCVCCVCGMELVPLLTGFKNYDNLWNS